MKHEKTPSITAYRAPLSIELPMEAEECIATSEPQSYTPGEDWGDDFDDDNN